MKTPNKLSPGIVKLLQLRLKNEYNHHYFYQSASNWCKNVGFQKAGSYFETESSEELEHARKIQQYLVDWNVTPIIPNADMPKFEFKNLADVIQSAYDTEYELYSEYEDVSKRIFEAGDICTFDFLMFFRTTQKDAVTAYSDMINILEGVDITNKFQMLLLEEKLF